MEKTSLEKLIEARAEARFNDDWVEFIAQSTRNPIAARLKITIKNDHAENAQSPHVFRFGSNWAFFNEAMETNGEAKFTNYAEVRKSIIEDYILDETRRILERVDGIINAEAGKTKK